MPKVSQQHLQARRQQILDAAARCFSSKGFHAATMQDIIHESQLSPGAIYRYFSSKDELIRALAERRQLEEREILSRLGEEADLHTILESLAEYFLDSLNTAAILADRRVGLQMWAEAAINPSINALALQGLEAPLTMLSHRVAQSQQNGQTPIEINPEYAARAAVALFHGFVLQKIWDPTLDTTSYIHAAKLLLKQLFPTQ